MKQNECEIVEDLMPLYIEHMASDASVHLIEEHVRNCESCQKKLQILQEETLTAPKEETKPIDWLKKIRRKTIRSIAAAVLAVSLLFAGFYTWRTLLAASKLNDAAQWNVQTDSDTLHITGNTIDESTGFRKVTFTEKDGILEGTALYAPKSIFSKTVTDSQYSPAAKISEIRINGAAVWKDGTLLHPYAQKLSRYGHLYVGDMPANAALANALGMHDRFGNYSNELVTDQKPYRWKLLLEQDLRSENRTVLEEEMKRCAYVLIALTDNLSEVEYRYTVRAQQQSLLITEKDADAFFEHSVKDCLNDPLMLNELILKTGLHN